MCQYKHRKSINIALNKGGSQKILYVDKFVFILETFIFIVFAFIFCLPIRLIALFLRSHNSPTSFFLGLLADYVGLIKHALQVWIFICDWFLICLKIFLALISFHFFNCCSTRWERYTINIGWWLASWVLILLLFRVGSIFWDLSDWPGFSSKSVNHDLGLRICCH